MEIKPLNFEDSNLTNSKEFEFKMFFLYILCKGEIKILWLQFLYVTFVSIQKPWPKSYYSLHFLDSKYNKILEVKIGKLTLH